MKLEKVEGNMNSLELFRKVDGEAATIQDVNKLMGDAKQHVGNLDDLVAAAKVLVKPAANTASARMNAFTL